MSSKKAVLAVGFMLLAALIACDSNPIMLYLLTRTAMMQTATATMWTPTPTDTPTPTFTPTNTLTNTPTNTPTNTITPTPDPRYYETEGRVDFSYIPPKGWKKSNIEGSDLQGWSGPGDTQLAFFDDHYTGSAADFTAETLEDLKTVFEISVKDEGELDLDSGVENYWIALTMSYEGDSAFFVMYFFSDGDDNIVFAMYGRILDEDEDQDAVVEDSMMTFRFD